MSVCLLLVSVLWAAPAAQATSVLPARAEDRLSGVWTLNKDLSTAPPAAPDAGARGGDRGGERGGGRPGGMGGGRGGMGGGFGGGRGGDLRDMAKARAAFEEFGRAPATWWIAHTPEALSFTDPDGVVRRFLPNGRKETVAMNGESIDVKTGWDRDVLTQAVKAGGATRLHP